MVVGTGVLVSTGEVVGTVVVVDICGVSVIWLVVVTASVVVVSSPLPSVVAVILSVKRSIFWKAVIVQIYFNHNIEQG